jgi:DNA-binding transcriptional ArsR family regulator
MTSNLDDQAQSVKAKLFRGLADLSRLRVLESLRGGPRCVSEVIQATGLSQPNTSAHLTCLWECGLVNKERRGRFVLVQMIVWKPFWLRAMTC